MAKNRSIQEVLPETYQAQGLQRLWRAHSDAVNKALLKRWMPTGLVERLLKTDLFDEAATDGLYPFLTLHAKQIIGMDLSFSIVRTAGLHHPHLQAIETDVRCLPFQDGTFDTIVSNSTLDHFKSSDDIPISLRELYRVLRPGGQMILTLDNLANPVIFIRSRLPFRFLHRFRIVPYYVGATCGPTGLRAILAEVGFKLIEVDTIMHCPRVLAVLLARWIEKNTGSDLQRRYLRFLNVFECLSRLPTRFLTGYFIAVRAIRPFPEVVPV